MLLKKSQQSILSFVVQVMDLLTSNNPSSLVEKGIAVAALNHFGLLLSERLIQEAGNWRSLDTSGKDWWVLENHPHIYAVRLDDEVWQIKEKGTTFTYMQSAGQYEILNLHIDVEEDNDLDVEATRTHILHLKLSYPDANNVSYRWDLHQHTTRHLLSSGSKELLAESKNDWLIPTEYASAFIFNPENILFNAE